MGKKKVILVKVTEENKQEALDAVCEALKEQFKEEIRRDPAAFAGSDPKPGGLLDQALKEVAEENGLSA